MEYNFIFNMSLGERGREFQPQNLDILFISITLIVNISLVVECLVNKVSGVLTFEFHFNFE